MRSRIGSGSVVLFLVCLLAPPPPAWAAGPETSPDFVKVQQAPGLNPDRLYSEISPTDHVDILTGALVVSQHLWTAPQAGRLDLSIDLHYSSTQGDARRYGGQPYAPSGGGSTEGGNEGNEVVQHEVNRLYRSWVGENFELSFGRIAKVAAGWTYYWTYIDETGAQHRLREVVGEPTPALPSVGAGPAPPPPDPPPMPPCPDPPCENEEGGGSTSVPAFSMLTDDGTYTRADYYPASDRWVAWFADGTIGWFTHRVHTTPTCDSQPDDDDAVLGGGYWLTRRCDRDGNCFDVEYYANALIPGSIENIRDSTGRVVHFTLHPNEPGDALSGYLMSMEAPAFGGQIAVTSFEHEPFVVFERTDKALYGGSITRRDHARLTAVHRPEGLTTSFQYVRADPPTAYEGEPCELNFNCPSLIPVFRQDWLKAVVHPTHGAVTFEYRSWAWEEWLRDGHDEIQHYFRPELGVAGVSRFTDGNVSHHGAPNEARWDYYRGCSMLPPDQLDGSGVPVPCPGGGSARDSCWGRVDVVGPDGNTTSHRFSMSSLDRSSPLDARELERTTYPGELVTSGMDGFDRQDHSCDEPATTLDLWAGKAVKHVAQTWDLDDSAATLGVPAANPRKIGETTFLRDANGAWVGTTVSSCDFDGFGTFGRSTTTSTGSLGHPAVTSVVTTTPRPAAWLFGSWVSARDTKGDRRSQAEARFDASGKAISRLGRVAFADVLPGEVVECPLAHSAALYPRSPPTPFTSAPSGPNPFDGSQWPPLTAASNAAQAEPLVPAAGDLLTTYAYGTTGDDRGKVVTLTRAFAEDAGSARTDLISWSKGSLASVQRVGLDPPWFSFRQDVDASTGLPASRYGSAGEQSSFSFDRIGRITQVTPFQEPPTVITYTPNRASSVDQGTGAERHLLFDGFGRLMQEERAQPDGTFVYKRLVRDASGRVVRESRWNGSAATEPFQEHPDPTSWIETSYLVATGGGAIEDPLGRVQSVTKGPGVVETFEYPTSAATRSVRAGLNGDPGSIVSVLRATNGLGQLVSVVPENGNAATATYEYDLFGELSRATLVGDADGMNFTQVRTSTRDGLGRLVASEDPEGGLVERLAFDVEGNVLLERDPNARVAGYVLRHERDLAGRELRLLRVAADGGAGVLHELSYDGTGSASPGPWDLGKLTRESLILPSWLGSGAGWSRRVRHSGLGGRPETWRDTLDIPARGTHVSFEQRVAFGPGGLVTSVQYPTTLASSAFLPGHELVNTFERGLHATTSFDGATPPITASVSGWAANQAPLGADFGNGVTRGVEQDALERIARISVSSPSTAVWDSGTFVYDGLENILSIGVTGLGGTDPMSFLHDAQGRLVSAVLPDTTVVYQFDDFGNMTARQATTWPTPGEGAFTNRKHSLGAVHDNRIHDPGFAWDGSGNLTASPEGNRTYTWDELNRMVAASSGGTLLGRHAYDPRGERLLVEADGELRYYCRDAGGHVLAEYVVGAAGVELDAEYVAGPMGELASRRREGAGWVTSYYGSDHLGTPRVLLSDAGAVQSRHVYEPFGLERPGSGPSTDTHRFTGHERDPGTGLDYMHARYFDAKLARFLSPDPFAGSIRPPLPSTWNRVIYALNSPVAFVDPDGCEIIWSSQAQESRVRSDSRSSPRLGGVLKLFDGPTGTTPRLTWKVSSLPNDSAGRRVKGETKINAVGTKGIQDVDSVTITMAPDATPDDEYHEVGHIDDFLTDGERYARETKATSEINPAPAPETRPEEQRADEFSGVVRTQIKEAQKAAKKAEKAARKAERQERKQ